MKLYTFESDDGSGDRAYLVLPDFIQEPAIFESTKRNLDRVLTFVNTEEAGKSVDMLDMAFQDGPSVKVSRVMVIKETE